MQVFKAPKDINTGTMVIIAPGGGLYAHSIKSKGDWVAEWLNKQGINAAVLKYRLVPTAEDGVAEITELGMKNPLKIKEEVSKVLPLSIEDGLYKSSYTAQKTLETITKTYGKITASIVWITPFCACTSVAMIPAVLLPALIVGVAVSKSIVKVAPLDKVVTWISSVKSVRANALK